MSIGRKLRSGKCGDSLHRKAVALLEITDLNQGWPKFQCGFNHSDCIIHDTNQIVLKEIRLKPVERFLEICSKYAQRVDPFRALGRLCSLEGTFVKASDLTQYQLRVVRSHFSRIIERYAEFVTTRNG